MTCHCRPSRALKALQEWEFDVMMNAVGLVCPHVYNFEEKVWSLAAMKVYGGGQGA